MDKETRANIERDVKQKVELMRERNRQQAAIAKQIAQILSESQTVCSELPEIWRLVHNLLVVQMKR